MICLIDITSLERRCGRKAYISKDRKNGYKTLQPKMLEQRPHFCMLSCFRYRGKSFQIQTFELIQDHNFHCIVFIIIIINIITSTAIINILLNHYSYFNLIFQPFGKETYSIECLHFLHQSQITFSQKASS